MIQCKATIALRINLNASCSQLFQQRAQVIYAGASASQVSAGNTVSSKLCRCEGNSCPVIP